MNDENGNSENEFDRDDFTVDTGADRKVMVPVPGQDDEDRSEFESDELVENATATSEVVLEAQAEAFEAAAVPIEGAADEEAEAKKRSEAAKKAAATRKKNEKKAEKADTGAVGAIKKTAAEAKKKVTPKKGKK